MNPLFLIAIFCFGVSGLPVQASDEITPVSAAELGGVRAIYAQAQQQEADALAAFREIRAMQSSRALQITLEDARKHLQIPAPERPPIDLTVLDLPHSDPARVVEQRAALREVNSRVDEILTYVRQLKEQLKEEQASAETLTVEMLREELASRAKTEKLAAEDEGEPSKDMTDAAQSGEPVPATQATVDASIANQAANEAQRMAEESEAKKQEVAPEAGKIAAEARQSAEAALQAATDARNAASQNDKPAEAKNAAIAAAKAAEAVQDAIEVAKLTGNLSFVAAEQEHRANASASKQGKDGSNAQSSGAGKEGTVSSSDLGGFQQGATKFLPGKARASRRIGGLGTGIEWIFIDSWYLLGPFPNPNRRNIDTSYPPESVIDLDAIYSGDRGASLKWQFLQSPEPYVQPITPLEYVIYYAYSELWCDQDIDLWVMVGSDDNSRIWINDQQIWKSGYELKSWRLNEGLRKVSFRRGINRILYRFENGWNQTGFSFAVNLTPVKSDKAPSP